MIFQSNRDEINIKSTLSAHREVCQFSILGWFHWYKLASTFTNLVKINSSDDTVILMAAGNKFVNNALVYKILAKGAYSHGWKSTKTNV